MKFRKKPVVIEATQWFKDGDHPAVEKWNDGDYNAFIDKLKQALAQPEQEPLFKKIIDQHPGLAEELKAMDEQEQEPVAWANPNDLQNFDMKVRTNGGPLHTVPLYTAPQPAQQEPVQYKCMVIDNHHQNAIPFEQWVKPPQRTWVGLTDDERNQLWRDVVKWGDPSHDDVDLMKAIEARLRSKNT